MFEYKVVPCPRKGLKAKGVKGAEAQFAHAMQTAMNEQAAEGWTYLRTDTWPMDERQGLTGKTTSFQTMMVFQREVPAAEDDVPTAGLIEDQSDGAEATEDASDDVAPTAPEPVAAEKEDGADEAASEAEDPDEGRSPSEEADKPRA